MGLFDIFKTGQYKEEIIQLKAQNQQLNDKLNSLGADEYFIVKEKIDRLNLELDDKNNSLSKLNSQNTELVNQNEKLLNQINSISKKISRNKELYKSMAYSIDTFIKVDTAESSLKLTSSELSELTEISPSIMLKLHCMDIKELRKAYRENQRQIDSLLLQYSSRYTTKSNKAIYNLMVIALKSELQNIIYSLKYEKLDVSIQNVKNVTEKYLNIAGAGNQSIVGTLTKFIGEIEYLFINAIKIEYNYYVKKEQAKQEQLAIRQQMREEAEERKALAIEKKKIEKEESKFTTEIEKLNELLVSAENAEQEKLKARILELQAQLSEIAIKKEEIITLENGKAGNVYIISNLGSFGENVFKIGMTRRVNPQERVDELGSASLPFKFDVHSFIFSNDAVGLENTLHNILNNKRVNKVNLRKEFFNVSIDELEELVTSIEPTAEFNKTMLAEEFRQSLSSDENYISDEGIIIDDDDEDDE